MLTHLKIKNFKSWRDTGDLRLAPLTVFFGSNSSGKSSINQFLLMLRQTAQSPDRLRVLHPGDKNTVVDLGTFRDIVFNHNEEAAIEFEMGWRLPKQLSFADPRKEGKTYGGREITFSAKIGREGNGAQDISVQEMKYRLTGGGQSDFVVEMLKKRDSRGKYELQTSNEYELVRYKGRGWDLPKPVRFYGFPDEVIAYYQNADFVREFVYSLEKCLLNIYYLGPLRDRPQRSYIWTRETPEHVGWSGERAVDAILAANLEKRQISKGPKARYFKKFEAVIAHWLKEMGLIDSFEVRPIAAERREYEVLIKMLNSLEKVNITDVGFGISQVLPVIVECFYAPVNSTIIIEQPEIHLHPSVQKTMADLFIAAIKARQDGKDRGIQLLVESHSEHFLQRLQRRIAEEHLMPQDTACYFVKMTADGSQAEPLQIDLLGNIENWPTNFFGNDIDDLAARTEAAFRRQETAPQS